MRTDRVNGREEPEISRLMSRVASLLSRRAAFSWGCVTLAALPHAAISTDDTFVFSERSLGLELKDVAGRVRIERVRPDSPAITKGVPPLSIVLEVNGQSTSGLNAEQVQSLCRAATRPVSLKLDASTFRNLPAVDQTEAAANALGMATDRVRIELLTGPQDPACGFKTREGDIVEIEYSARIAGSSGREFDSSAARSGRPFAFLLGNGDVVRGVELGTLEMCIGEERRVTIPPLLGFGSRGSKVYGVPPDAVLEYTVKLVSINSRYDANARRADIDDEQRFSEDEEGTMRNAATLGPR